MEGYKKAICKGNFGYPSKPGKFIPIKGGIDGLIEGEIYWIPKDFDLTNNELFKEIEEGVKENVKRIRSKT